MKRQKSDSVRARWNRFDICSAWYVYSVLWHSGQFSREYRILGRLRNICYNAGLSVRENLVDGLTKNATIIYNGLVDGAYIREI